MTKYVSLESRQRSNAEWEFWSKQRRGEEPAIPVPCPGCSSPWCPTKTCDPNGRNQDYTEAEATYWQAAETWLAGVPPMPCIECGMSWECDPMCITKKNPMSPEVLDLFNRDRRQGSRATSAMPSICEVKLPNPDTEQELDKKTPAFKTGVKKVLKPKVYFDVFEVYFDVFERSFKPRKELFMNVNDSLNKTESLSVNEILETIFKNPDTVDQLILVFSEDYQTPYNSNSEKTLVVRGIFAKEIYQYVKDCADDPDIFESINNLHYVSIKRPVLDRVLAWIKSTKETLEYERNEVNILMPDYSELLEPSEPVVDNVNHPKHYKLKNGVEVIDLVEQLNFNRGNAIKYIARAGQKDPAKEIEDLEKALWYLKREIERTKKESDTDA